MSYWHQLLGALNTLGSEVWFQNGCGLDRCFPSVLGIVAKFPRQKSGSISPYFCGGNLVAFRLRCVIAHKMLFSPSFRRENTAMGMPHFHGENPAKFLVQCVVVHQQGFTSCMQQVLTCSYCDEPKPFKAPSMLHTWENQCYLGDMD